MQSASAKDVAERRAEIVTALSEVSQLEFVNGGGTGSIESTAPEWALTQVAAGSRVYGPMLFDHHPSLPARPPAMIGLPGVPAPGRPLSSPPRGGYLCSSPGAPCTK